MKYDQEIRTRLDNIRSTLYEMSAELSDLDSHFTLVIAADLHEAASKLRVFQLKHEYPPTPPEDGQEGEDLTSVPF